MSRKWRTLISLCLLSLTAFPGNTYGWLYYVNDLKSSLQISSLGVGILWFIAVTMSSATLPLWGYIMKSWGERWVLTLLSLLFVTSVACISVINSSISLFLVIFALRSLQGGFSVISAKAINTWYRLHEKTFPSIIVCGCNFLTEFFPPVLGFFLACYSVQYVALMEAAFIAVLLAMSILCFSNKSSPKFSRDSRGDDAWEQFWFLEDEIEALGSPVTDTPPMGAGTQPTRSCLFWLIVALGLLYQYLWSAISFFSVDLFKMKGMGEQRYINIFYVVVAIGSVTCFIFETFVLRLYGSAVRIWVMTTHCFLLAAACVLWFLWEGGYFLVVVSGLLISFSGAFNVMYTAVFAHLWGTGMESWIYSLVITLASMFAGLGPVVLGSILDYGENNYLELMFLTCAVANVVVGLSLLFVFYRFWVHAGYELIGSTSPLSCAWS